MHSNVVWNPPFQLNFGYPSKKPTFRTLIQMPVSGRGEIRASLQPYPLWEITYDLNYARGGEQDENSVYQYLLGFFLSMGGSFSDFLYLDPYDNEVDMAFLATGDGSTTNFQLTRPIGIGSDIVQNLNGIPTIYTTAYAFGSNTPFGTENFLIWSQDQTQASWSKGFVNVTGPVNGPDGGLSGCALSSSSLVDSYIFQSCVPPDISLGGQYTFSVWLKADSGTPTINLNIFAQSSIVRGTIPVTINTGWQRYSVTANMQPGDSEAVVQVGGNGSFTESSGGIDIAWCQLEPGNSPSAYISTGSVPYQYTITFNGIVQFSGAPANEATVLWSGKYYYRVRFEDDDIQFDQFMHKIWSAQSIKLKSVIY